MVEGGSHASTVAAAESEKEDEEEESLMDLDIELDLDYEEVSSQYDSCYSSGTDNTTTLFSEVTNYKYENGRRYHAYSEGHYWQPNDDQQNNQLDTYHHVITLVLDGKMYLSPIDNPKRVFDLGTGTGIWAIEMADAFPGSQILGNDLSPVQPTWIPANCTFEVDDFTRPWLHPPNSFDFVFARALYGCVADWPKLLQEAYNSLTPGGWFESIECGTSFFTANGELPENHIIRQWCELVVEGGRRSGKILDLAGKMGGMLKRAGFVNVEEKVFRVPHGPWPKDRKMKTVGKYNMVHLLEGCEGFTLAFFIRYLGWDTQRTKEYVKKVEKELKNPRLALYYRMVVAYGQKPLLDADADTDADTRSADEDSAYYSGGI